MLSKHGVLNPGLTTPAKSSINSRHQASSIPNHPVIYVSSSSDEDVVRRRKGKVRQDEPRPESSDTPPGRQSQQEDQDSEPPRKKLRPLLGNKSQTTRPQQYPPRINVNSGPRTRPFETNYRTGSAASASASNDSSELEYLCTKRMGITIHCASPTNWVENPPRPAVKIPRTQSSSTVAPVNSLASTLRASSLNHTQPENEYMAMSTNKEHQPTSSESDDDITQPKSPVPPSQVTISRDSIARRVRLGSTLSNGLNVPARQREAVSTVSAPLISPEVTQRSSHDSLSTTEDDTSPVPDQSPSARHISSFRSEVAGTITERMDMSVEPVIKAPPKKRGRPPKLPRQPEQDSPNPEYTTSTSELDSQSLTGSDQAELYQSGGRSLRTATKRQTAALRNRDQWIKKQQDHPFVTQLRALEPEVTITNEEDDEAPPASFKFIKRNKFSPQVIRPDPDALYGCQCIGSCDPRLCSCIDERNAELQPNGEPWALPYDINGRLKKPYLDSSLAIFECNSKCTCQRGCRNRLVQFGRQIPLEIFKTQTRGWGLRSPDHIKKGTFIDTYKGEILTDTEASARSALDTSTTTRRKDNYLFSLDKFKDTLRAAGEKEYVIDGEYYGGPARFINHSCAPNLKVFAVSMLRGNPRVYELAFFATRDILAGEELGFDYEHRFSGEGEDEAGEDADGDGAGFGASQDSAGGGGIECLCGADDCRGRFW